MKVQEVYYIFFIYKDIHYFFAILHCTAYRQSVMSVGLALCDCSLQVTAHTTGSRSTPKVQWCPTGEALAGPSHCTTRASYITFLVTAFFSRSTSWTSWTSSPTSLQ